MPRLGETLYACGDLEGAAAVERRSVELAPYNAPYRWALVISLLRLDRRDEAHELARSTVALAPDDPSHRLRLGRGQTWQLRDEHGALTEVATDARIRFDSAEALRDAAVDGLGIAQLPDFLTERHLAEGRLARVLEAHEDGATPIVAIYPTRKHLAPKVRLFIDHLVEAERESLMST